MAFSFAKRLRERLEQVQSELTPETGFDRRAYGYDDDAREDDATFEEVANEAVALGDADFEEESPWRQRADYRDPGAAPYEDLDESPFARAPRADERGRETPSGPAARAEPAARGEPAPAPVRARASAPPPTATAESERVRAAIRAQRLRTRLRQPDSLREVFLLREVIDRPAAFRRRRGRAAPPR